MNKNSSVLHLVWEKAENGHDEKTKKFSPAFIATLYEKGCVDTRHCSLSRWQEAFRVFRHQEADALLTREDLASLRPFFLYDTLRRPFDPATLKEGPRPFNWLLALFEKALRFETTLSLDAWKKIVQEKIYPAFKKVDHVLVNASFKALLSDLLLEHASPLRKLELWLHAEAEPVSEKSQPPRAPLQPPPQDSFNRAHQETLQKKKIDELYFHRDQQASLDDEESLRFLEEIVSKNE